MPGECGMGAFRLSFLTFFFIFCTICGLFGFELDNFERAEVQKATRRLLEHEKRFLERGLRNFLIYKDLFLKSVYRAGLPEILIYLPIIESGCSPRARSRAGAVGLWQLMPSTAYDYHLRIDYWVDERKDPVKSTEAALKYLKRLFGYYGNWELALAAYNAGPANINRAIAMGKTRDYWILRKRGVLSRETSWYIPRFYAIVRIAESPAEFDLNIENAGKKFTFQVLELEKSLSIRELCARAGIPYSEIRFLNPELRRAITPPGRRYNLKIPAGSLALFLSAYHGIKKEYIEDVTVYTVKSGDTIGEIAERFGTSLSLIKLINGLRGSLIYAGQELVIPVKEGGLINKVPTRNNFRNYSSLISSSIRYKIRRGDTLWDIAERYRIEMEVLLALNGIGYNEVLMPGDEILIPVNPLLSP